MRTALHTSSATIVRAGQYGRWLGRVSLRVASQPRLWSTAIRQVIALAPPQWWRSPSHMPSPPESYLRFRSVTAYGGDGTQLPTPDDVVTWLEWTRGWR